VQEMERNLVKLIVPRNEAMERIEGQKFELVEIFRVKPRSNPQFDKQLISFYRWHEYTYEMLRRLFSNDEVAEKLRSNPFPKITSNMNLSEKRKALEGCARVEYENLLSTLNKMDLYPESQPTLHIDTRTNAINIVERLATRFHLFASQLANRQRDREPFSISDEYDLQDLFHALLRLFFDDVRPEEYTPSYAAKSSKIDFILKQQQIAVELKITGPQLCVKEVANQLIIDTARYRSHPDCQTLICFVYDPDHLIKNPVGLENDLSRSVDNIDVKVIVSPK